MAYVSPKRKPGIYVAWKTVTYRSVLLMLLGGLLLFVAIMHLAFPQFTENGVRAANRFATDVLEKVASSGIDAGKGLRRELRSRRTSRLWTARYG